MKIKHNNVLGYHIDVRAAHGEKLLGNENFIHRQTTAQAVRFTTTALSDLEKQLSTAADQAIALEIQLFAELADKICRASGQIAEAAMRWPVLILRRRQHGWRNGIISIAPC